MRQVGIIITFISVMLFPWPLWASLTLVLSAFEPLVALAIGIFADTLYYTPDAASVPLFTLLGASVTVASFFVRSWLKTSLV